MYLVAFTFQLPNAFQRIVRLEKVRHDVEMTQVAASISDGLFRRVPARIAPSTIQDHLVERLMNVLTIVGGLYSSTK